MNKDISDLITALCVRAAILMEDASAIALGTISTDEGEIPVRLDGLERSTDAMVRLIAAARVLANAPQG